MCYPTSLAGECYAAPLREVTSMGVVERLRSARNAPPSVKLWLEEDAKWNERKRERDRKSICGGRKVESSDIFKPVQAILRGQEEVT